jgi:hypothetical protein
MTGILGTYPSHNLVIDDGNLWIFVQSLPSRIMAKIMTASPDILE